MLRSILLLLLIQSGSYLIAQEYEVPENYVLDKAEDYAPYEDDVVNGINWLMATPYNEQSQKRSDVNAFLLKWFMGSPEVHIDIRHDIVNFMGSNPDLLIIFIGGWGKYSIETRDYNNKIEGNLAGLEAVVRFYTANSDFLAKDRNVEKYVKLSKKNKLREFVTETLQ